ncbi:SNF2-related protein [Paenibacillus paeoniae]|uniref:DEAD/DEAH box helicase n=1 Tax=Paenibacillus paeoniae TaxID=2292705 RepID=A0A371PIY3_9BACL|nr:SNF2-related protein [Paenibacillus paeoniae]REK76103.1 hypothetical protein DX130_03285 [Paenibacillus paeoniae]
MEEFEALRYIFFSNKPVDDQQIQYYKLQASIIDKLNHNSYAFVFDEPGAGKTVQGIYSIWNVISKKTQDEPTNILIIAPNKQLANKWRSEIKQFLMLDFSLIGNSTKDITYNQSYVSGKDNLYITYNSSNYSNLGITQLTNYDSENIYRSDWDLIICDEAHDYYTNYLNALFSDTVELKDGTYYKNRLAWFGAKQVLVLTATPIKFYYDEKLKLRDDFRKIKQIPERLLLEPSPVINEITIEDMLVFDSKKPVQRYFKETVLESKKYKNRQVEVIEYKPEDLAKSLWKYENGYRQHCFGNIFLLVNRLQSQSSWQTMFNDSEREKLQNIYKLYSKSEYTNEDVEELKQFDVKLREFINKIDCKEARMVIFVESKDTQKYLTKVFKAIGLNVFSLSSDKGLDIREKMVSEFNHLANSKVLITTWDLGNYGLNMHGGDTVACYEASRQINQIEQGFGRIDRINKGFNELKLILFKADGHYYDSYVLMDIYRKLFTEQLKNAPSKNMLFTSDYLDDFVENVNFMACVYDYLCSSYEKLFDEHSNALSISDLSKLYIEEFSDERFKEILYDLHLYSLEETVTLEKLKNRRYIHFNNKEKIQMFLDKAMESGINGSGKIHQILSDAIYYWKDGTLHIHSLDVLLESSKNFVPKCHKEFQEALAATNLDIRELARYNSMKLMKKMIEKKYHSLVTAAMLT